MSKSADAFRTISEVADWLGIQAHVLRFWESKFTQVKPIKRAGGRRYYRPADMQLLGGIKKLLHDDGLTIKGVQKILREEGMSHVASLSAALDDAELESEANATRAQAQMDRPDPAPRAPMIEDAVMEDAVVLPFGAPKDAPTAAPQDTKAPEAAPAVPQATVADPEPAPEGISQATSDAPYEDTTETPEPDATPSVEAAPVAEATPEAEAPAMSASAQTNQTDAEPVGPVSQNTAAPQPEPEPQQEPTTAQDAAAQEAAPREQPTEAQPLPAFLRKPDPTPVAEQDTDTPEHPSQAAQPETTAAPRARDIGMPPITPAQDIPAQAALLSRAQHLRALDTESAGKMQPLLEQLTALRDRMAARRSSAAPKS